MEDWYRSKEWNREIESKFFARLKRSRKWTSPQYVRIQAVELIETKLEINLDPAQMLLELYLKEYPDEKWQTASVYTSLGDIARRKSDDKTAMEWYRKALWYQKEVFTTSKDNADIKYSVLVVKNSLVSEYSFIEELLLKEVPGLMFPVSKYFTYSVLSIINSQKGRKEEAIRYAKLANSGAEAQNSGLRYHKGLGLVTQRDKELDRLVQAPLATGLKSLWNKLRP